MGDVAKDLTAGTVGGAAQLICGHPFDTIKVKLQSQPVPLPGQPPKFSGAMDAVKQTIAAEGPRGLYKGMGAPLATVAAFNAVLFSVRGQMETLLRSQPGVPLTVYQQVLCGAGAGLAVSFLACPTELIKCRFVFSVLFKYLPAPSFIFLGEVFVLERQTDADYKHFISYDCNYQTWPLMSVVTMIVDCKPKVHWDNPVQLA